MYDRNYLQHFNAMQDCIYTATNKCEYDPYLMHYGVMGMKWGQHLFGKVTSLGSKRKALKEAKSTKRLTSRSKSLADRIKRRQQIQEGKKIIEAQKTLGIRDDDGSTTSKEKMKTKVLNSRSAKELYKHADLFTYEELNSAYNRLALEKRIADLEPKNSSLADKWVESTMKATKISNNAQQIANNGIKLYNAMANISNSLGTTKLKTIDTNNKKDKDKDKDKDNDDD